MNRIGGTIAVKCNGSVLLAKGAFSYNLGVPKRETVVGADTVHGVKEVPQPAFIEGEITDQKDLDLRELASQLNATVTLDLANGKTISLRDAAFVGEATGNTEEGAIPVRWEGPRAEEIK